MNYPELAKVNSMSCPSLQRPICGSFYLAKSPWELGQHTICLGIVLVTISFKCNTNALLKENILYVVKCSPAVYLGQQTALSLEFACIQIVMFGANQLPSILYRL